jgi:Domain of unknown function (DUF4856)
MKSNIYVIGLLSLFVLAACKKEGCTDPSATNYNKKAKKDDGSCKYSLPYTIPTTYSFVNSQGNNTVDYSGQTDRLNHLREMIAYAETGTTTSLNAQVLKDMFNNANGNGNGSFSFTSSRQLQNKCFSLDTALIISYFDALANASNDFSQTASNGQAGVLTSGTSSYLFAANGFEYTEMIEKAIMAAVFKYQALNIYLGSTNMSADNTTLVSGQNYTNLEHYWDEAFGYFGVPSDFPTTAATDFWGKYCNSQDANLGSNALMMNNFLKGRAAIANHYESDKDASIQTIRETWEAIAAYQAMRYLDLAVQNFGTDQAKTLHVLSEAYGFIYALRFAPLETRNLTTQQVDDLLAGFGSNLWNLTLNDIQSIKTSLDSNY